MSTTERRFGEEWWEEVGEIGVDSGTVFIGDPAYIRGNMGEIGQAHPAGHELWERGYTLVSPAPWSAMGAVVQSGLGDGRYLVVVRKKQLGHPGASDPRIAEVRVVFLPDRDNPSHPGHPELDG